MQIAKVIIALQLLMMPSISEWNSNDSMHNRWDSPTNR